MRFTYLATTDFDDPPLFEEDGDPETKPGGYHWCSHLVELMQSHGATITEQQGNHEGYAWRFMATLDEFRFEFLAGEIEFVSHLGRESRFTHGLLVIPVEAGCLGMLYTRRQYGRDAISRFDKVIRQDSSVLELKLCAARKWAKNLQVPVADETDLW